MALRISIVTFFFSSFFFFLLSLSLFTCTYSDAQESPAAIYVFGDSLVDVGNNNYLKDSQLKADFPHNGIDFPGKEPTGRFSNGNNSADFIAEKVGLPSPPPYLSLRTSSFPYLSLRTSSFPVTGVSFASGGAGIFNTTNENQTIPLHKQMEYFSVVYEDLVIQMGSSGAQAHLSKSLFTVVIGSNDLFSYFTSGSNETNPQQYVDSLVLTLKGQLEGMHGFGARNYVITGIGAVGCCPVERKEDESGACKEEANYWAVKYNEGLKSMLEELQSELKDINYSYLDVYSVFASIILTPAAYGFTEVKAACCGLGNLRADVRCVPCAEYCSNRSDHLFWDIYHPTETAARIIVDTTFDLNQLNY